jgi:hypothetical protein
MDREGVMRETKNLHSNGGTMQNAQSSAPGTPPGDGGVAGEAADRITSVVTDARNVAGQVADGLKAKAVSAVDERKGAAAETLGTVAGALRGAAQGLEQGEVAAALGTYADGAAAQLDKVAGYLREKDLRGLTRDTETFARRHPEVFLGGAFLAGILAARFLKSSRPRPSAGQDGGQQPGFAGGPQSYRGETEAFNPPHFESTGGQ